MGGWGFETFLEGSVDDIIYRYYITNRRSSIYCSLAVPSLRTDRRVNRDHRARSGATQTPGGLDPGISRRSDRPAVTRAGH